MQEDRCNTKTLKALGVGTEGVVFLTIDLFAYILAGVDRSGCRSAFKS